MADARIDDLEAHAMGLAPGAAARRAHPHARLALTVLVVCAGYYGAGILAFALRLEHGGISDIWLPHGVLLAALMLTPPRHWWLYLAALLPVHLHLASHFQGPVPAPVMLIHYLGNAVQATLGGMVVQRLLGAPPRLDGFRPMTVFLVLGVILPVAAAAALVAWLFVLSGWIDDFGLAWHRRTLAGVCGGVALTPLIVQMAAGGTAAIRAVARQRKLEFVALTIGILALILSALSGEGDLASQHALFFAPLPLLLWTAVRFGPGGLSLHLLFVALGALAATKAGHGPFVAASATESVLSVQAFLLSVSIPLLLLAALVSERNRSGRALHESEERLRLALAAGRMGAWDWDLRRKTVTWSKEHFAIMGLAPFSVEPSQEVWASRVHPDDRPRADATLDRAIAERKEYRCEYRVVWPDGTMRWVEARAEPIYDDDGQCVRVMGLIVDITERKRAEGALQASEARYREVVESQTELVCRYLPDTTLTFVNDAYCRYFGRRREELIGRKFVELIPDSARAMALDHIASLVRQPRVCTIEHEVLLADGTVGWQQWVDSSVVAQDGRVAELQGIGRDITDRKRAEEANQRLAHASRLAVMGELTASIAHEINQPLGAILSNADAAELLLEADPGRVDEVRRILADIRKDDLRASQVIRRMRELLRNRQLEMQAVDLNEAASDVMRLVDADAQRRQVAVEAELAPGLPAVRGDRVHLQQVLLNLLLNGMEAMADTPPSQRRLAVRTAGNESGVEVAVTDSGPGIAPERLSRLFESFFTTKQDGMGLGLSIARSIVEAHGGRIWAENRPEGGAAFRFTMPKRPGG